MYASTSVEHGSSAIVAQIVGANDNLSPFAITTHDKCTYRASHNESRATSSTLFSVRERIFPRER